jgi:hypothetical protein
MSERERSSSRSFELGKYGSEIARQNLGLRVVSYYGILAMVALTLLFLPLTVLRLETRTAPLLEVAVTAAVVCLAGFVISQLWLVIRRHPGLSPARLVVSSANIHLVWPDDSTVLLSWSDPNLSFELDDYSGSSPSSLATSTNFGLRVRGTEFPIPEEAFRLIYTEATRRQVVVSSGPFGNIFYKRGVVAVRHQVLGRSRRSTPPSSTVSPT